MNTIYPFPLPPHHSDREILEQVMHRMRELRQERGFSNLSAFAAAHPRLLNKASLYEWESCRKFPNLRSFVNWCRALDADPSDVLDDALEGVARP